jgi:peptide/nickel transport system permease protein
MFVIRRLAWSVMLIFVITLLVFVMFFLLPSDSRNAQRNERGFTPGLQTQFNAHGSFPHQYAEFLRKIIRGDLGTSLRSDDAVTNVIRRTLPITFSLMIGGLVMWLLIAVPVGVLSALYPRSLLDRGLMLFVLAGASAHSVFLGLVFSYTFGVRLHWFPVGGYCELTYKPDNEFLCGGPRHWAHHMFLPWLTFAFLFAALYARMIRASLLESMEEDYVRTARAKGASSFRVMRVHVFRNALLPIVSMIGMDIGVAFGGALFIETIFELPGMGFQLVHSLANSDLPMIMGIVIVVSFAVVLANLVVDLLYLVIDPRIRRTGKGDAVVVSRAVGRELRAAKKAATPAAESATSS